MWWTCRVESALLRATTVRGVIHSEMRCDTRLRLQLRKDAAEMRLQPAEGGLDGMDAQEQSTNTQHDHRDVPQRPLAQKRQVEFVKPVVQPAAKTAWPLFSPCDCPAVRIDVEPCSLGIGIPNAEHG